MTVGKGILVIFKKYSSLLTLYMEKLWSREKTSDVTENVGKMGAGEKLGQ